MSNLDLAHHAYEGPEKTEAGARLTLSGFSDAVEIEEKLTLPIPVAPRKSAQVPI
jgi:hypothetical protein